MLQRVMLRMSRSAHARSEAQAMECAVPTLPQGIPGEAGEGRAWSIRRWGQHSKGHAGLGYFRRTKGQRAEVAVRELCERVRNCRSFHSASRRSETVTFSVDRESGGTAALEKK